MSGGGREGEGFTRVPPHSIEAEESVIGAVFLDNTAFDRVADIVTGDHFYVERNARIFAALSAARCYRLTAAKPEETARALLRLIDDERQSRPPLVDERLSVGSQA